MEPADTTSDEEGTDSGPEEEEQEPSTDLAEPVDTAFEEDTEVTEPANTVIGLDEPTEQEPEEAESLNTAIMATTQQLLENLDARVTQLTNELAQARQLNQDEKLTF